MLTLHRFLCIIGKMKSNVLKFIVVLVVTLVGVRVLATPFSTDFVVGNLNSTLFSKDIDINKYGNHLQRRNIQLKKVDYNYSQRVEQKEHVSIIRGASQVSTSAVQVTLQNNTYNGCTRTGVTSNSYQNVAFNRPMSVDAYLETSTAESFVNDDNIQIGDIHKVAEDGVYGDGAQPGPITDVVWGFLFFALGYVVIRRFY